MRPVFIGGCERSGTTMLGAMLGSHPSHLCPPEMPFKIDLLRAGAKRKDLPATAIRSVVQSNPKAELQGWRIGDQTWGFESATAPDAIRTIVKSYGELNDRSAPQVWIDHTPNNIRWAATLAEAFPESTFVHIIRDARAVAASLMELEWGSNTAYRSAHYWLEGVSFGLAAESALKSRCTRVRYEDLVIEPEATLQQLCKSIDIEYDAAMVESGGYAVNTYSRKQHALVGQAPDSARASAWERKLSSRKVEIIESIVADELRLLGYEPRFGLAAVPPTRRERWSSEAREILAARIVNRFRKRLRIRRARRDSS